LYSFTSSSLYLGSSRFSVNIYCTYIYDGYVRKKIVLDFFYQGVSTLKIQLLKQKKYLLNNSIC